MFRLDTDGTGFTVLKHFTGDDGAYPFGGLTLSGSVLYGTTTGGGGQSLGTLFKLDLSLPLSIQSLENRVILRWTDPAFALQSSPEVMGTFTNIPNATSPHTNVISAPQQFFRLIVN